MISSLTMIELIAIIGTIAFAVSGALMGAKHQLDIVGMMFLACITGVGGGTLRDIILDIEVFWLVDWHYIAICVISAVVVYYRANRLGKYNSLLIWADAVGMALFAALGAAKALGAGANPLVAAILGMFGACLGGVIRDTLVNEIPLMMRKEIYVTAALTGGLITALSIQWLQLSPIVALVLGGLIALFIRGLALIKNISLPQHPGID